MRRPRDVKHYPTAGETAAWLRQLAEDIEHNARECPLVKVQVQISNWNPAWEKIPAAPTSERTQ